VIHLARRSLAAAAGYFAFSFFVFFRLDPVRTRVGGRLGFGAFHALNAVRSVFPGSFQIGTEPTGQSR